MADVPEITLPTEPGEQVHLGPKYPCRYCGGTGVYLELRFEAQPLGTYSVAGVQTKFAGSFWPYGVCGDCGHTSRGKAS